MSARELHRQVLELEAGFWRYAGAKEAAIADRLGLTPVRYYQILNAIIDDPPAELATDFGPLLNRLRRMREQRLAQRNAARRRTA